MKKWILILLCSILFLMSGCETNQQKPANGLTVQPLKMSKREKDILDLTLPSDHLFLEVNGAEKKLKAIKLSLELYENGKLKKDLPLFTIHSKKTKKALIFYRQEMEKEKKKTKISYYASVKSEGGLMSGGDSISVSSFSDSNSASIRLSDQTIIKPGESIILYAFAENQHDKSGIPMRSDIFTGNKEAVQKLLKNSRVILFKMKVEF
ncbi:hypothetical protein WD019_07490 [Fictibacillus sp. Mic-4]|uniref:hypothetical protein n=1 Tax=Fictibacillus TaxID=1329200 RepID=UPI000419E6C4|nr:hypothetical protein [Fictibacillus gelatini]